MDRRASAVWKGGLKDGNGMVSTESGALADQPYSFRTRFESERGTNPEELVGAAHSACFSMALSAQLEGAGHTPDRVTTSATVTIEKLEDGFAVTKIHLQTRAQVPGLDQATFADAAEKTKSGCPISKLLKAEITLDAQLEA